MISSKTYIYDSSTWYNALNSGVAIDLFHWAGNTPILGHSMGVLHTCMTVLLRVYIDMLSGSWIGTCQPLLASEQGKNVMYNLFKLYSPCVCHWWYGQVCW